MERRHTRRDVLRCGAGLGSLGAIGCLGGCLGGVLGGGGSNHLGWIPAPPPPSEAEDYTRVFLYSPRDLANNEDEFDDRFYERATLGFGFRRFDVGPEKIENQVTTSYHGGELLSGSFSTSDVVDQLETNGFEERTSIDGYRLYARGERPELCYAVKDDVLRHYDPGNAAVDQTERALETWRGERDSFRDRETAAVGADFVGRPTIGVVELFEPIRDDEPVEGLLQNSEGRAMKMTVDGTTTRLHLGVVYGDESDVDTADLEQWVEGANHDLFDSIEGPTYERDGAIGYVDATIETAALTYSMFGEFMYALL